MRLVILQKGKQRPVGYISPGGYKKTASGWRKVSASTKKASGEKKAEKKKGVFGVIPSMSEILKIKSKLSESIYQLRKVMQSPHTEPTEYQRAIYKVKQTLLRSVPKTYTPDQSKANWYRSVRKALQKR